MAVTDDEAREAWFKEPPEPAYEYVEYVPDSIVDEWIEEHRDRIIDLYQDEILEYANAKEKNHG